MAEQGLAHGHVAHAHLDHGAHALHAAATVQVAVRPLGLLALDGVQPLREGAEEQGQLLYCAGFVSL